MKKLVAMLLVLAIVLAFAGCAKPVDNPNTSENTSDVSGDNNGANDNKPNEDENKPNTDENKSDVMTYADFAAAAIDAKVVVETYVQATQSWWDNKITVYCQSKDGAYFAYELACAEADAAKLVAGTKIKITGTKGEWSGEVEIMDGTFEFVEGGDTYIAEAFDATSLLGTDDLIKHQNEKAAFKGLTVEKIEYKNGEPGDDIYLTLGLNGKSYSFCVERYLTDPESDVYKTVGTLKAGDVVDVEGFLYWYEGANPHITAIAIAK